MNTNGATEKLMSDLKLVVQDAEELLKATAGEMTERAKQARVRLNETVVSAKETCQQLEEKALAGAKNLDEVVRKHPYESLGVAAAVGLVAGLILSRK